jgi:tRNA-specific 2-thiouridylase
VVVAMSGGVDSSVAAALLQEQGHDVIGVGLRLPEMGSSAIGACCGMAGMVDARRVAEHMGIPFYVLDYRDVFEREVIAPFCHAYAAGETPNPCALCNERIKFGALLDTAMAMDAEALASGHYARLTRDEMGDAAMWCGRDASCDQSYFLSTVPRARLVRMLFPVGELGKAEVRRVAHPRGLPVAAKPASQDICFVGQGGYREVVAGAQPEALQPGPILDIAGFEIGAHRGLMAYTLGQRKGLGIAAPEPLYVIGMDARRNALIVGPVSQMAVWRLRVRQVNRLAPIPEEAELHLDVRARHRGALVPARVTLRGDEAMIDLAHPHPRIASGQVVAFYRGGRVMAGGIVARSAIDGVHIDGDTDLFDTTHTFSGEAKDYAAAV